MSHRGSGDHRRDRSDDYRRDRSDDHKRDRSDDHRRNRDDDRRMERRDDRRRDGQARDSQHRSRSTYSGASYHQSHDRDNQSYARQRDRSRSKSPKPRGRRMSVHDRPTITPADLEGKTEDEKEMILLMGFSNFDSTKGRFLLLNPDEKIDMRDYED